MECLSYAEVFSVTTTGEADVVCSSYLTITPLCPICLSFSHAGSSRPTGIFLGGWTTWVNEGSISKCTLLDSLLGGGVVVQWLARRTSDLTIGSLDKKLYPTLSNGHRRHSAGGSPAMD